MLSTQTWKEWIRAFRLIPAAWGWHPIVWSFVTLTSGVLLIALNWACQIYEIPFLESKTEADLADAIVFFFSLALIMGGGAVCLVIDESSEAKIFRNLPISRYESILISSLNIYSMSFASMLILMIGMMVVGAQDKLYLILTLAYLIHLTAGGVTISIVALFLPYMRSWDSESRAPLFLLVLLGWLMAVLFCFARDAEKFVPNQFIQETPWESFLLPSCGCALLSWFLVYGVVSLPVLNQHFKYTHGVHKEKGKLLTADMLIQTPPGRITFQILLQSWGFGFLTLIAFGFLKGHLGVNNQLHLYDLLKPYIPLAGFVLIVAVAGVLLIIPITFVFFQSLKRIIFFIPLWHTLPIPDRWVPNFFAVGIYILTILMGIDWILSDQLIEILLGVGMVPLGLQMLCTISFIQNPSIWGHHQQNVEGFVESMLILSQFSFFILVLILGSFSLILLAIPLACIGTIYSYWAMHWMWKRF